MPSRTTAIQHAEEPRANALRCELEQYVGSAHKTFTPTQAVIARAEGCWLETLDDNRLLDFTSGVLVANLGHNHPRFESAYARYAAGTPRNCYNAITPLEPKAAGRLVSSLNCPRLTKVLWADSGSAGIIKAIWAAQHARPDKRILVATRFGFHGKKGLAGDVTGSSSPNPDVRFISFPMEEVRDVSLVEAAEAQQATLQPKYEAELEALARQERGNLLLLITEPYLGAAGSYHPPKWYMRLLRDWCTQHDVILVFDEVQSCHGRTGELFAFQKHGIEPDLVVLGKGLGNGEPIAAAVGSPELIDSLHYGEASDTYSGNPRACAAILAVLDVFESEPIVANCREMSTRMRDGLSWLRDRFPFVAAIRGEGLVWGIEAGPVGALAAEEVANRMVVECYRSGLHLLGPLAGKVLRVSPPLVITASELQSGIERMYAAFERVAAAG
ncbi:aspartate aminotransferase family protein [Candidatus Poribacteria bacterium]|nr:aspartate aminotransferase family protein [Candidatus Poribacteria bacterium]